jgi:ribonuclease BN (tRNA processing enzyme)
MALPRILACLVLLVVTGCLVIGSAVDAQTTPASLELVVLGSGGPGATGRAASCYLLMIQGIPRILVDAGPGAFVRLGESKLSLSDTDIVLLTHLHVDHAGELPGLFKARAVSGGEPIVYKIWGPAGSGAKSQGAYFLSTTRFLDLLFGKQGAFAYLSDFAAPFTIQAHDISAQVQKHPVSHVIVKEEGLVISAIAGHHRDAPAVIYRIDYAGKSITFSGDIDAQGLPGLRVLAKDTDLLVFNSVVLDPPGSPSVLYALHTPPHVIGQLARDAGVRNLLLSHLSPAVEGRREEVLKSIRQSYSGSVDFADDAMHVRP